MVTYVVEIISQKPSMGHNLVFMSIVNVTSVRNRNASKGTHLEEC